jgi:predicted metal-binding protein
MTDNSAETSARPQPPVLVSVCVTCRASPEETEVRAGTRMYEAVRDAIDFAGAEVRPVQCLGVCKHPATVSVTAPAGYTFVFGDLNPETGADALAAFVRAYAVADYGYVPWRERPKVLRGGLVVRIPPSDWSPEDGRPPA